MKRSSILAAVLTLGIATAATTACAFENEFHGMFAAQYINSNFNGTDATSLGLNTPRDTVGTVNILLAERQRTRYSANFIEQRARLQYIAKASSDLKLVTQFEIDYTYWGNSAYTTGRGSGGAIGADSVNFETKNIYIDANPYKNINMKLGMMPYNDAFKGTVFDADMAGIAFSSSYNKVTPSIGYFRFNDTGVNDNPTTNNKALGHLTNDMFLLDGKYEVNKDLKVGAAYYLFRNDAITTNANDFTLGLAQQDVKLSNFGLNAEYTNGPLTLNGFAILQTGTTGARINPWLIDSRNTTAWALNSGVKFKTGPGTARFEFLYTSGENAPPATAMPSIPYSAMPISPNTATMTTKWLSWAVTRTPLPLTTRSS